MSDPGSRLTKDHLFYITKYLSFATYQSPVMTTPVRHKLKNSKLTIKEIVILLPLYIVVLIGLLFSLMGLSEFYEVSIAGHESGYPWGPINENPWYYKNASIYTIYNFVSGILFLLAFLVSIWGSIKKNRKILFIGVGLTGILLLASFISTDIK